ncbi:MAG: uncharacterized protein conserved in archaea [Haloquadratum walsbyi J07HQW1]|jgi:Uncharacterized protein conserved in archaea|uniref:Uncharacterized protein conserved in archaea n=1 Tax=Haloquadratum walsbyi J07HQW1 TaxID=1238424 RepID=U1PJH3_9EURY|nr:MAG: uncharacterized protein conserved in archaea [Haloquadratum walsbyi J07HQW1]
MGDEAPISGDALKQHCSSPDQHVMADSDDNFDDSSVGNITDSNQTGKRNHTQIRDNTDTDTDADTARVKVTLGTKCYVDGSARDRALDSMGSLIENDIGGLTVSWSIDIRDDEFILVTLTGGDATAASNLLAETWGEIYASPKRTDGDIYTGTLDSWNESGWTLDVGDEYVTIPASELGLGQGSPTQIRDRFGVVQHTPLRFVAGETPRLADSTRDQLYEWTREPGAGRVNVNSATRGEVRATINRAGHANDIVTVDRLGLLEQSVICTEDTDPPGLIASIGSYLRAELKCVLT